VAIERRPTTMQNSLFISALVTLVFVGTLACSEEEPVKSAVLDGDPSGGSAGASTGGNGATAPDPCAGDAKVNPGCPCPSPDAWIACGKVEQTSDGYAFCSDGFKLCVDGVWTKCEGKRIAIP
jgi:hypothetical protein